MRNSMRMIDQFDCISPIDYRYRRKEALKYLSENAFTEYKKKFEIALMKVHSRRGRCSEIAVKEVEGACAGITTGEVYDEEDLIGHDIRALVNCICARVSEKSRPMVHVPTTSYDNIDSANALRYRDACEKVLIPTLTKLELTLIEIALREAETLQMGRTHCQHAAPITFGFAMALYVSRLGGSILKLSSLIEELHGKCSGLAGAYNGASILYDDPEDFEREVLAELELEPAEITSQIVPPEALTRVLCEVAIAAGILANLGDDMRNLQRPEIGEVKEQSGSKQVNSSTSPKKRNPLGSEHVKSCAKVIGPRIQTVFLDQISDHQRDLTNSMSARTYGEIIAYGIHQAARMEGVMRRLLINRENMMKNVDLEKGAFLSEPLYIILATLGHPSAHEKVRQLTIQAEEENQPFPAVFASDAEIKEYLPKMTVGQRAIFTDPKLYVGIAAKKARQVAERWRAVFVARAIAGELAPA